MRWPPRFIVAGLFYGPPAEPGEIDPVSCGVLAGYLFGAFMLVLATAHDAARAGTLFALTVATVAIAWRSEAASWRVPVAAIFATLVIVHWARRLVVRHPGRARRAVVRPAAISMQIADIGLHLRFAAGDRGAVRRRRLSRAGPRRAPSFPILWARSAVATPVVLLIALYYRIAQFERSIPFAGLALLLAALYGFATENSGKRAPRPGIAAAGAIFATGAVAALALALTFALERGWLTVALALMVPGIAWIADKRPLPMLRKLCGRIAVLVLARVGWDPRIVGSDVGTTPIFNWLLYGYGVPAVSFWVARLSAAPARRRQAVAHRSIPPRSCSPR